MNYSTQTVVKHDTYVVLHITMSTNALPSCGKRCFLAEGPRALAILTNGFSLVFRFATSGVVSCLFSFSPPISQNISLCISLELIS